MRYIVFFIASLMLISSCTLIPKDDPTSQITPTDIFIPSPTQPIGTGGITFSDTGTVSLSWVLDLSFIYLDSEKNSYASGTLYDIIKVYPHTIVYFYPKDGTPNCTIQALDFSMMLADFRDHWYNIIGISKDDLGSHRVFAERNELKIQLIQDGSGELLRAFGAEWPLQEYGNGHELSDIIRSTYVIDNTGKALYAFRDVTAKWHARSIYELVTGTPYNK